MRRGGTGVQQGEGGGRLEHNREPSDRHETGRLSC